MVREVIHDPILLARKSVAATPEDREVAQDLLDTLAANREACVGMAANMIGVCKNIIVFDNDGTDMLMFNPEIVKAAGEYTAEECCLSCWAAPERPRAIRKSRSVTRTKIFKCG